MKLSSTLLAVSVAVYSFGAYATSESFSATVKIQNTVILTKGDDLNFGTIRAVADPTGASQASLTISPNPDADIKSSKTDGANALISIIEEGSPATFKVSDVVPNARLTISDPSPSLGRLESNSQGLNEPQFEVNDWKYFITSGTSVNQPYDSASPNLIADEKGEVGFAIGATLSTYSQASSEPYKDVEYTGTFQIEVAY